MARLPPTDRLQHRCIRVRLPNSALFRWRFEKDGESLLIDMNGPMLERVALGYFMERDGREDLVAGRLISVLEEWMQPSEELCIDYPGRRNLSVADRAFVNLARELGARPGSRAI